MLRQSFIAIANWWPLLTFFYHLFYSAEWGINFSHKPFFSKWNQTWWSTTVCLIFIPLRNSALLLLPIISIICYWRNISMHDPVQSLWFICQNNYHSLTKFNIWFYGKIFYYYCLKNWTIWNITWIVFYKMCIFLSIGNTTWPPNAVNCITQE